jgi:nitrate/TMAO reductase-like tetraheme cytochrome c subunit
MKKVFFIALAVMLAASFAVAQNYVEGSGLMGIDKLGAHQNGGRGCTGCHAPHSGAFGAGGNAVTGQIVDKENAGNYALWGQDLGPLYGITLGFGDNGNFQYQLPTSAQFETKEADVTGTMMCLSCHDGNIAKGAMMTNWSYEQKNSLLPPNLYGPNPIPTLLGNDGTTAGNYQNDHPIGPQATLKAVGVSTYFTWTSNGCGTYDCLLPNGNAAYTEFIGNYGAPNIISNGHGSPVVLPDQTSDNAYLVCTTCHTPHAMYIASANKYATIHGKSSGQFPSYWFIAAPYNPGSNPGPKQASSTTQFCRQCHFSGAGGSNEASGIHGVTTAF